MIHSEARKTDFIIPNPSPHLFPVPISFIQSKKFKPGSYPFLYQGPYALLPTSNPAANFGYWWLKINTKLIYYSLSHHHPDLGYYHLSPDNYSSFLELFT